MQKLISKTLKNKSIYSVLIILLIIATTIIGSPKLIFWIAIVFFVYILTIFIFKKPSNGIFLLFAFYIIYPSLWRAIVVSNIHAHYLSTAFAIIPEIFIGIMLFKLFTKKILIKKFDIKTFKIGKIELLLILYIIIGGGLGAIITLVHGDTYLILYGFHYSLTPLLFYFVGKELKWNYKKLNIFLQYFIFLIGFLAIAGILLYLFRPSWYIELASITPFNGIKNSVYQFYKTYIRMYSLMFSANIFGSLMAIGAILAISKLLSSVKKKWYYGLLFVIFLFCNILSFSRGAWAFLIIGLTFFLLSRHKVTTIIKSLRMLLICFILCLCMLFSQTSIYSFSKTRFLSIFDFSQETSWGRLSQARSGFQIALHNPIGVGLGRTGHAAAYHATEKTNNIVADSGFIKILNEFGFFGLGIFFIFLFKIILSLIKLSNLFPTDSKQYLFIRSVVGIIFGLSIQAIGSNSFDFFFVAPLIWFLTGSCLSLRNNFNKLKKVT